MHVEGSHLRTVSPDQAVHIGFTADLHIREKRQLFVKKYNVQDMIAQLTSEATIGVIAGDLTDHGQEEEAKKLCQIIAKYSVRSIPWFYTDGNHDNDSGKSAELQQIYASEIGMKKLQGTVYIHHQNERKVGLTGIRGFGGGFGVGRIYPIGDPEQKAYVETSVREAKQLDQALKQLRRNGVQHVAAFTHYGSIYETSRGKEPPEINIMAGCEIFGEVADKYRDIVDVMVHGHLHYGEFSGETPKGIPVYNVPFPLLLREFPAHPFLLYSM